MLLRIILGVILATSLLLLFVPQFTGSIFGSIGVERAAYDVVQQVSPNTQIRRYHPCVLAETPAGNSGTSSGESSAAFRRLGQYIGVVGTPSNEDATPIAMTAPVVTRSGTMSFVLPAEYQRVEMAPRPSDPQVTLRRSAARTCAVLTFSGYATDTAVSKRATELTETLRHMRIQPLHSEFEVLRYNPPFTIPMLRTNEILVEIHAKHH